MKIGDIVLTVVIQREKVIKMQENKKPAIVIGILVLIVTWLHYSTNPKLSGLHDFYRMLYYVPIIISAFRYRLKGGFLTSLVVSLVYAPHLITYFGKINVEIINQLLEIVMFMASGLIIGYLVEKDDKRRKALEQQIVKLTDLENYTQNILDSIDSGVIALDCCNKIKSINRQGIIMFKNTEDIFKFFDDNNLYDAFGLLVTDNRDLFEKDLSHETIYGTLNINLKAYPIKNILNKIEGIVILIQDTTKIKKLEAQLRRGEKLATVGKLASGIAHEVRNPLAIIKTISQTIDQDTKDEELKEAIQIINHEIDRANGVIKGLLDFAKPNKDTIVKIDLEKVLAEMVKVTQKYAQQKKINLNLIIEEKPWFAGDIEKLKQAFINIILNGIQSMNNGGVLIINLLMEENWIVISFKDQGMGIGNEIIDKIFDPFFTTKDEGTGLGLSITERIVEEHQGHIEVRSNLNAGTDFRIYLPIQTTLGQGI